MQRRFSPEVLLSDVGRALEKHLQQSCLASLRCNHDRLLAASGHLHNLQAAALFVAIENHVAIGQLHEVHGLLVAAFKHCPVNWIHQTRGWALRCAMKRHGRPGWHPCGVVVRRERCTSIQSRSNLHGVTNANALHKLLPQGCMDSQKPCGVGGYSCWRSFTFHGKALLVWLITSTVQCGMRQQSLRDHVGQSLNWHFHFLLEEVLRQSCCDGFQVFRTAACFSHVGGESR
mmetsp:Transcript_52287/g.122830  ORF Transcript_52287/g.122830 Transcript_52287/m.122830 type:complete len:231 (+) Transcript_52287:1152-1844(+)